MNVQAGQMLLHYRMIEKIGEGGMGVVWKADDTRLGRQVALKLLPKTFADDARFSRFETEARSVASLNHPNVVTVHALETVETPKGTVRFIVMEYVTGKTLREVIPEGGFPFDRLLKLALPLTDALAAAHRAGTVHRDLKPENIMLDAEGRLRVLDFGLAGLVRDDGQPSLETVTAEAQGFAGTLPYMSPEQLEGGSSSQSVDIFAIGAMLHELACGEMAFARATAAATVAAILSEDPPPLADRRSDLPPAYLRLVDRCLRKDPLRRLQTVRDVHNELLDLENLQATDDSVTMEPAGSHRGTVERTFKLSVETVRGLAAREPSLIGDVMTYLDNGVKSDTLVIYLGGLGLDQSMFASALARAPHRSVAVSLYGFGPNARFRTPLSLDDHSHLLRALFRELDRRYRPLRRILVGFSAGADHALRMAASPERFGVVIDGLLALGANVSRETCMFSRPFLRLPEPGQEGLISIVSELGREMQNLSTWLILHDYLVQVFRKFGGDTRPLKRYAMDLVSPFDGDGEPFVEWYRAAVVEVETLRVISTRQEQSATEALLMEHLESDVFGPDYCEETLVVRTDLDHLELAGDAFLEGEVAAMVEATRKDR